MGDLQNPNAIKLKGLLFLILGIIASGCLMAEAYSLRLALLHLIAVWAFCRFYYFAFYVIQHYVDPKFRFSGLTDFVVAALKRKF